MTLREYQEAAIVTAKYPDNMKILYPVLGLCGESGEVAEKVKKIYRDEDGIMTETKKQEIVKELGDVLWYLAAIAKDLDISLEEVANININKLHSRKQRGVIHGYGDNR